jgi:hypothetical protein
MLDIKSIKEADCIAVDTNSVIRNTASAIQTSSPISLVSSLVNGSAILGGVFGLPIGASAAYESYQKGKKAFSCGFTEGILHHALWGGFGAGYAGISGILTAEGVMGLQKVSIPPLMTPAFGGVGLAMNGLLLGYGANGLWRAHRYGKELEQVLQKEGERGVLNWLHNQIDAADPLERAKKWSALELRISPACAELVREKLPSLLTEFDLNSAKMLIQEVRKSNYKEQVKYSFMILIAVVSAVAFACLLVASGPACPILFALGSLLWLTIDSSKLQNYIGEKCWEWHSNTNVIDSRFSRLYPH